MTEIDTIVDMLSGSSNSSMLPADWQPSGEAAAAAYVLCEDSTGRSSSGTLLSRRSSAESADETELLAETSTECNCYR